MDGTDAMQQLSGWIATTMGERYDFAGMERKWQERWKALGLFRAPDGPRDGAKCWRIR